jgi:uncharacterized protein (DUF3820 family)
MSRHGRATMPWGKFKGVRISLVPDDYLSFLTTTCILSDPKWDWLRESLLAELRHRGLRVEGAEGGDPEEREANGTVQIQSALILNSPRPRRAYCFD